jgi:hypothetical protein
MTHVEPDYYSDEYMCSDRLEISFRPVTYSYRLHPSLPIAYHYYWDVGSNTWEEVPF